MKNTIEYHKIQYQGPLRLDRYWPNSKISLVDPHRTKIEQNAPSCSPRNTNVIMYVITCVNWCTAMHI